MGEKAAPPSNVADIRGALNVDTVVVNVARPPVTSTNVPRLFRVTTDELGLVTAVTVGIIGRYTNASTILPSSTTSSSSLLGCTSPLSVSPRGEGVIVSVLVLLLRVDPGSIRLIPSPSTPMMSSRVAAPSSSHWYHGTSVPGNSPRSIARNNLLRRLKGAAGICAALL